MASWGERRKGGPQVVGEGKAFRGQFIPIGGWWAGERGGGDCDLPRTWEEERLDYQLLLVWWCSGLGCCSLFPWQTCCSLVGGASLPHWLFKPCPNSGVTGLTCAVPVGLPSGGGGTGGEPSPAVLPCSIPPAFPQTGKKTWCVCLQWPCWRKGFILLLLWKEEKTYSSWKTGQTMCVFLPKKSRGMWHQKRTC